MDSEENYSGETQQKSFICVECSTGYSTRNHLNRHILASHSKHMSGEINVPEVGDEDNENGKANEQRFSCVHCGVKYWWQRSLKRHILEKHPDEIPIPAIENSSANEKEYCCVHCGAEYEWLRSLQRHLLEKHPNESPIHTNEKHSGEQNSTEPNPNLLCVECGAIYRVKQNLEKHILTEHSKTLKCEKCDFTTGSKAKLNKYAKLNFCYTCFIKSTTLC